MSFLQHPKQSANNLNLAIAYAQNLRILLIIEQREMDMIIGTSTTPTLTLETLRGMVTDFESLSHARFVVDQCASQIGRAACLEAYAELDRIENELNAL